MKSIERKIKAVQEKVTRLKKISDKVRTLDEYQSSQDLKDICERNLQVAIESCLDIGKMIISAKQLQEPKDNKGIFEILAQAGIVSQKTLSFLIPMAGVRNILVHGYDKIDDSIIYGILKRHLDDFMGFLKEIKGSMHILDS